MSRAAAWALALAALAAMLAGEAGAAPAPDATTAAAAGQEAYDAGRFAQARQIWTPLAQASDPRAQLGLGFLDDLGQDGPRRPLSAYQWYLRAAEAGLPEAQFNVATMRDSGLDVGRDAAEAALWYAKAAAHGYPRAEYNLAQLYASGDGVPRNPALAAVWYRAAAEAGVAAAKAKLATLERAVRAGEGPQPRQDDAALHPARIDAPLPHAEVDPRRVPPSVELVWTAPAQPAPTTFFVQVMALGETGQWRETLARYVDQSALLLELDPAPASYAWRVYVVAQGSARYAAGDWNQFEVVPPR